MTVMPPRRHRPHGDPFARVAGPQARGRYACQCSRCGDLRRQALTDWLRRNAAALGWAP